jgi:hypothetical protein
MGDVLRCLAGVEVLEGAKYTRKMNQFVGYRLNEKILTEGWCDDRNQNKDDNCVFVSRVRGDDFDGSQL